MMQKRRYNEKDVVINFSVLPCFRLRWGGEPFLAVSATYDEADTEAHGMELTNLYPPPCISLTEILLGAGAVILISFLGFKLRRANKEIATLLDKIRDVDITLGARYGQQIFQLKQDHLAQIDALEARLADMQRRLNDRPAFVSIPIRPPRRVYNYIRLSAPP